MAGPRNWVALFLMGAINNLPYVIVNSASNTLADSFGQKNLVGLVFGANVALSVFVKGLNTFFLLSVPFAVRYVVNGCLMLLGLFGVAYAFNFGFALACVVVVGSTAAFGENVSLGMLSRFPSHMINAWSSGTGMAGLLGGSIYVLFGCTVGNGQDKREKMHNLTKYAFLMTTSVVLIYWLAFFVVLRLPREEPAVDVQDDHKHPSSSVNDDTAPLLQDTLPDGSPEGSVISGKESTWLRIKRCLRLTVYLASNLCAVYVFEYVARGCAAKVRPASEYHVGCPELYAAIQLCYQTATLCSGRRVCFPIVRAAGKNTPCGGDDRSAIHQHDPLGGRCPV
ncbi:battenin-like isoform X3 [Littorina saxatilis]|uniref:battenin-like isoform X3 n=1 Tax=Littorina saxatilis TaxID=31220 RepID=UPI0038B556EC